MICLNVVPVCSDVNSSWSRGDIVKNFATRSSQDYQSICHYTRICDKLCCLEDCETQ